MKRWGHHFFTNVLPVLFIVCLSGLLTCIHHLYRVRPLLELKATHEQGRVELIVVLTLTVLWSTAFLRASTTSPGTVPDVPEYRVDKEIEAKSYEVKMSGGRRHCKWCDRFKPDRCHHCRQCRSCVLRMDHHCPWIGNCVGFRNHKYFFLLVVYSAVACWFFILTLTESLTYVLNVGPIDTLPVSSATNRFLLLFGLTVATLMGCVLLFFLSLHTKLMLTATSTVEHCEKNARTAKRFVSYDLGYYENIKAVLGEQPLFWLLPFSPPKGDGMSFRVANADSLEADLKKPLDPPIVLKVDKKKGTSSPRQHAKGDTEEEQKEKPTSEQEQKEEREKKQEGEQEEQDQEKVRETKKENKIQERRKRKEIENIRHESDAAKEK